MNKAAAFLMMLLAAIQFSCCLDVGSREKRFRKRMLCARRVNNDNSIRLLKNAAFCCPRLPSTVNDVSAARRYYYMEAAALCPDKDEALDAVAQTFWDEDRFTEALDYYARALKLSPSNVKYRIAVVTMQRVLKMYPEALASIADLEKIPFEGREKTVNYLKGKVLYERGDLDASQKLLEATLPEAESQKGTFYLGPTPFTMKDVFFYLAMIRLKKNEPQKAHEYFLEYLSKEGHPDFVSRYTDYLRESGGEQDFLYGMVEDGWTRTHQ